MVPHVNRENLIVPQYGEETIKRPALLLGFFFYVSIISKEEKKMKTIQAHSDNYLSNRFTEEDFANMNQHEMYALYSAPDTGKTTLITDVLQKHLVKSGKTALYLTSRLAILNQIGNKINDEVMTCCTYQKVETVLDAGLHFQSDYDFIICDEAHYFVEDSLLTQKTDLSFGFVNQSNAIVILMTGTPDYIECLEKSWRRPIKTLIGLDKSNHNVTNIILSPALSKRNGGEQRLLHHLDRLISQRKRIVVYDSSIADLHNLFTRYETQQEKLGIKASFICSAHNKSYRINDHDKEALEKLMDTERIDSDILFITSALNTGVSINEDFDCLFIFGSPSSTAIFQLIARVRKGATQRKWPVIFCSVPLYHTTKTKKDKLKEQLLRIDNPNEWVSKRRTLPDYVYEDQSHQLGFNHLIITKHRQDIKEYTEVLSHCDMINAYKAMFERRYDNISIAPLGVHLLIGLLNSYGNHSYLLKSQQNSIKLLCKDHHIPVSISKINEQLTAYGCNLQLKSTQKKIDKTNCQVWEIKR